MEVFIISNLYPDLPGTNYPDKIDTQLFFNDPTADDVVLINQYYAFLNSGNFSAAKQLLLDNPRLDRCINTAEKETRREHQVIALQRQYMDDFQKYIVEAIKPRGDWLANEKYYKLNSVRYNSDGMFYLAVSDNIPVGDLPTNAANWYPITIVGPTGASGLGMTPRGLWDGITQYYQYDVVSRSNALWYAKVDNKGITPGSNESVWEVALGAAMIDLGASSNITGILGIEHGGTGASTPETARIKLDVPSNSDLAAKQPKIKGGSITLIGGNAWTAVGDLFQQSIPVQNLPADPGGMSTTTCTTIGWPFDSMAKAGEYGVGLYEQLAGKLIFRALERPDADLVCNWSFEEVEIL